VGRVEALPEWPEGTVAVVATAGEAPHAIPVSLVLRAGPLTLTLGLAPARTTLGRLRADPRCSVTVLAAGDLAFTAHGRATAFEEAGAVIAVTVAVERIADHNRPTYTIHDGVRWEWTDAGAETRDAEARAALSRRRS
jgi:hypothetical protein